jgi:hypothetical protein
MQVRIKAAMLVVASYGAAGLISAQGIPSGYTLPPDTISSDHHYGVLIPHFDRNNDLPKNNKVMDLVTSRVVAEITADPESLTDKDIGCDNPIGWDHELNHHENGVAEWSSDSSLLLWSVEGKWGYDGLMLLKFSRGKLIWKRDILAASHKAIIVRMRKAAPSKFQRGSIANEDDGCWYPRGYAVDERRTTGPLTLPMTFSVGATSNVKQIPDFPTLEAHMKAVVDRKGAFAIKSFDLGRGPDWVFN